MGLLDADFNDAISEVKTAIPKAMPLMKDILVSALQTTIENEVYAKYDPKVYLRRSEDGSLGTPLSDVEANSTITVTTDGIEIDYQPTGEHDNLNWWDRDGDDLINWIAAPHDGIPARPFWDEYTNMLLYQNGFEDSFIAAVLSTSPNIEISPDGDVAGNAQN